MTLISHRRLGDHTHHSILGTGPKGGTISPCALMDNMLRWCKRGSSQQPSRLGCTLSECVQCMGLSLIPPPPLLKSAGGLLKTTTPVTTPYMNARVEDAAGVGV